jgi:hypothetical protein
LLLLPFKVKATDSMTACGYGEDIDYDQKKGLQMTILQTNSTMCAYLYTRHSLDAVMGTDRD